MSNGGFGGLHEKLLDEPAGAPERRAAHDRVDLPLFPLNTVLFPGGPLPLRIFEPRYVDMVGPLHAREQPFGVVLIIGGRRGRRGGRAGGRGYRARIVDFSQLPDGLLGMMCRGSRRFRLRAHRAQSDGLNIGEIEWLSEPGPDAIAAEHRPLAQLLRRVLKELGETARHLDADFEDADWVSNRLAEFLPLSGMTSSGCWK